MALLQHVDEVGHADDSADDLVAALRDFLEKESPPAVVHEQDEQKQPPLPLLAKLGGLGYLGLGLPETSGGGGGDTYDVVRMIEEIAYHNLALGHLVGRTFYAQQLLLHFGTEAQRERWLPALLDGKCVFSVGISEPGAGSDAAALRTTAIRDGDDFVLNGQKVFSSSMGYASVALVAARTGSADSGRQGVTTFLIDPKTDGIECRQMKMVGDWGIGTYEVFYDDVRVPADCVLGELGEGWKTLNSHLVRERTVMAARAVGATQRVLDVIAEYVCNRRQFGHPIADFQVVQHKLANIAIEHFVAQAAVYQLARDQRASRNDSAMVKTFAAEMYCRAAIEAMQLSGGYGYTHEYEMQRHFRDSRIYPIGGGSSEVMRDIVARQLLKPFRR